MTLRDLRPGDHFLLANATMIYVVDTDPSSEGTVSVSVSEIAFLSNDGRGWTFYVQRRTYEMPADTPCQQIQILLTEV